MIFCLLLTGCATTDYSKCVRICKAHNETLDNIQYLPLINSKGDTWIDSKCMCNKNWYWID